MHLAFIFLTLLLKKGCSDCDVRESENLCVQCGHRQLSVGLTCLRCAAGQGLVPPEAHSGPLPVLKSTQPLGETSAALKERRREGVGTALADRQAGFKHK